MESSEPKRRFPPPWRVERIDDDCFHVVDANGVGLASIYCRDDLQHWTLGNNRLTSDEARRIANAIARLPEFLTQRRGFYSRGGGGGSSNGSSNGYRWKPERPYHVALEDSYLRAHWDEIDALCRLNGMPFDATGEKIHDGGQLWRVYEFTWQMDAILFWDRFEGRWLRGNEFHFPERPKDLPPTAPLPKGWPKFDPRKARG
jgi:hypothetical protein